MRFLRPGRLVLYLLALVFVRQSLFGTIRIEQELIIKKGQSASILLDDRSWIEKKRLQWTFRQHRDEIATIQPGTYIFTGSYTPTEIVEILRTGPSSSYQRITLLEGRSSRDIDKKLADEGLIEPGMYRTAITDPDRIRRAVTTYPFLAQAQQERTTLTSLEGYLYPETYMIDPSKDVLDQLIYLQLETFMDRVREPYSEQLLGLSTTLQNQGYAFILSTYGALILASIIEKEERIQTNKPTIASIFFNRLDAAMRIDADISLCYGLAEPYETCTPTRIVAHLQDSSNPYNTRAVNGLPPTPIASVHVSSITALLDAPTTDLFYYLHNPQGKLFTAKTLSEHNTNKSKELQ